ncbi:MAG: hypothetical protein CVU06_02140, partial [Bacteroidetes bacterium HGW-Bacteroidetes-22]
MKKTLPFFHLNSLKFLLLLTVVATFNSNLMAQQDSIFWFAAPDVDQGHGDSPVCFRIMTLDQPANVTLTEPASTEFPNAFYKKYIPAYSMASFRIGHPTSSSMTDTLAMMENTPYGTVNKKGLLLHSSTPVSAYYEVAHTNNPMIVTLKGKTALGKLFYIPSQDAYPNNPSLNGREAFDIVATENNTTVNIT